jgi:hypothetical protein
VASWKRVNTHNRRQFSRPYGNADGSGAVSVRSGDIGSLNVLVNQNMFHLDIGKWLAREETSSILTRRTVEKLRR